MNITDLFLKLKVLATALSLMLLILGIYSVFKLPIRLFPQLEIAMISIKTVDPGATPEVIQGAITSILEESITGIEGIDYVKATNLSGKSTIEIYLKPNVDADNVLTKVAGKVNSVRHLLPQGLDDPVITKTNADDDPIFIFAFTSSARTRESLSDYLRRWVQPKLEAIDGVSSAEVLGNTYAMRIWLDPNLLGGYQLTPEDVAQSVLQENVQATVGMIRGNQSQINMDSRTALSQASEFDQIILKHENTQQVRIVDVGHAELGPQSDEINAFFDGKPAIMVFIHLLPGSNPLEVAKTIHQAWSELQTELPSDIKANMALDASDYIKSSLFEVFKSILISIFIVSLVIYGFLRNHKLILIPLITIPISLLGTCVVLDFFHCSLNTLTLLAMVIAIGLVVDDAIIVLENITRHFHHGKNIAEAASEGAKEIVGPVIFMTLTLSAAYIPMILMDGLTGALFKEFALTLAVAVIISGMTAITLSPLMSYWLLRENTSTPISHARLTRLNARYVKFLTKTLQNPLLLKLTMVFILTSCFYYAITIPKELAPKEDQGYLQILGRVPDSTNIAYLTQFTEKLEQQYAHYPDIAHHIIVNGIPEPHQLLSFVNLNDWNSRHESITQLQSDLQKSLNLIPGMQAYVISPSALPISGDSSVAFALTSLKSHQAIYPYAQALLAQARASGLFQFIKHDLLWDEPEIVIRPNRDLSNLLGINMADIARNLELWFSGQKIQSMTWDNKNYDVILQLLPQFRLNPELLNNLMLKTPNGFMVPLVNLADISMQIKPHSLNEFQKNNAVNFTAELSKGHTVSEAIQFLNARSESLLPDDIKLKYSGETRRFIQEGNRWILLYVLSGLMIFLLLAIQFESYFDPLVILFGSVPMAIFGGLLFLKIANVSLNIYTQISLLTLMGLISKHGILIVKFSKQLEVKKNLSHEAAIIQATQIRARPILMTTLAMILGAIPLGFATGPGAVSRSLLGWVMIAGLSLGTILTLLFLPSIYVVGRNLCCTFKRSTPLFQKQS